MTATGELRMPEEEFRRLLGSDPILPGTVIADDGEMAAINLLVAEGSADEYPRLVETVRHLVRNDRASVSGVPVFRVATDRRSQTELALFFPISALLMTALVRLSFGTWRAVLAALLPGLVGTCAILGLMGYAAIPLNVTSVVLPPVLMALSTAYMMHFLVASCRSARHRAERAIMPVLWPVAISALTTAVGFLAIALVPVGSVRTTGLMGAFGTVVVGLSCLVGGPALITALRLSDIDTRRSSGLRRWEAPLATVVSRRARAICVTGVCVGAAAVIGLAQLRVGTDVTRWFPEDSPVRASWDRIRSELVGLTPMNFILESKSDKAVTDPDVLAMIDEFAARLEELPSVGKSIAITDPLRAVRSGLDGKAGDRLPSSRAEAEQYLLLLGSVEQISDFITSDRRATNILIRADDNGSMAIRDIAKFGESWWAEHGAEGVIAKATGTMFEFARAEDEIAFGQLRGFGYAVLSIVGLLGIAYWDRRIVFSAVAANVAPIGIVFGIVGLLNIRLDAGMVLVGSIAIGIAVDDSIHVISAFRAEARNGMVDTRALERVFGSVFEPIMLTTAAVAVAFGVLALSGFAFMRSLGLLTAAVMFLCLVTDLFLLPILLKFRPGWRRTARSRARACASATEAS